MLTVMDMSTGKKLVEDFDAEFGAYRDEVLNAGWLPPAPGLQLGLQEVRTGRHTDASTDIRDNIGDIGDTDAFIAALYRNQGR